MPKARNYMRAVEDPGQPHRHHVASKTWTADELAILAANPGMTTKALASMLPERSVQAIGNKRKWYSDDPQKCDDDVHAQKPPVKPPGEYEEVLGVPLVEDFECMEIWMKWNGYASYREIGRDMEGVFGQVFLVCEAKLCSCSILYWAASLSQRREFTARFS